MTCISKKNNKILILLHVSKFFKGDCFKMEGCFEVTNSIVYSLMFEAVSPSSRSDKIPMHLLSFLFVTALNCTLFRILLARLCPKKANNETIEPTWRKVLLMLNGEARSMSHGPQVNFNCVKPHYAMHLVFTIHLLSNVADRLLLCWNWKFIWPHRITKIFNR